MSQRYFSNIYWHFTGSPVGVDWSKARCPKEITEQGPVLEARNIKLAAVSGIVGIRRAIFELGGKANHAGGTPMELRRDAMAVAGRIICAIEDIARAHPGTV
ncbi:MAG: hypothetical protein ACPGSC_01760, partial [Granulosicoccaceae bacterium]